MLNSIEDLLDVVYSSAKIAKKIKKAADACYKRNLVLIKDDPSDFVITAFATDKRCLRLFR